MKSFTLFLCSLFYFISNSIFAEPDLALMESVVDASIIRSVKDTPIHGLSELTLGSEVLYLSEDGRYLFQGDILDLQEHTNLTEISRNAVRAEIIGKIDSKEMIIYPALGETKHILTIFTDFDCAYCRQIHREVSLYNEMGIEIRYLPFPVSGFNSEDYKKVVSVWCSDDRKQAFNQAMNDEPISIINCDNTINNQYLTAIHLGVSGPPAIISEKGILIPGYIRPKQLQARLN